MRDWWRNYGWALLLFLVGLVAAGARGKVGWMIAGGIFGFMFGGSGGVLLFPVVSHRLGGAIGGALGGAFGGAVGGDVGFAIVGIGVGGLLGWLLDWLFELGRKFRARL